MKVLMINGSPHVTGNTYEALKHMADTFREEGIEADIVHIGTDPIQGCIGCLNCLQSGTCAYNDPLFKLLEAKAKECDALVVGSPVYYAGPTGSLCAILDRLFCAAGRHLSFKPAASVSVCSRSGSSAAFDRLNKYFTMNNMPVVSSHNWNSAIGSLPGEVTTDREGMEVLRVLARNMAWLMRKIKASDEENPKKEEPESAKLIRWFIS